MSVEQGNFSLQVDSPGQFPTTGNLPVQKGFLQRMSDGIAHGWDIFVEKGGWLCEAITLLFFNIIGFFSPTLAHKLESAWGSISRVWLRLKAAFREDAFLAEIDQLKQEKQTLNENLIKEYEKTAALSNQIFNLSSAKEHVTWEREVATTESQRLVEDRQKVLNEQAPLLIENRKLKQEIQVLQIGKQELLQQYEKSQHLNAQFVQAKKSTDEGLVNEKTQGQADAQELAALRIELKRSKAYQALNQTLDSFQKLYLAVIQSEGDRSSLTKMALETVLPQIKEYEDGYRNLLQEQIDLAELEPQVQVGLQGLLSLSKREANHLEKVSQALHLIEELRRPSPSEDTV
jgi:hypothetical protein